MQNIETQWSSVVIILKFEQIDFTIHIVCIKWQIV